MSSVRCRDAIDVVERLVVLSRDNIVITDYPVCSPLAVFNPAVVVDSGCVTLYSRAIMGYFTYTSCIIETRLPLDHIYSGEASTRVYESRIVVSPSNKYDLWGTEDPRVYRVGSELVMTYCGRTINFFNRNTCCKTVPVTAIYRDGEWVKNRVYRIREGVGEKIVSDKDAFLVKMGNRYYFFHRPIIHGDRPYLVISTIRDNPLDTSSFKEDGLYDTVEVIEPAPFEEKIGWATPPIRTGNNKVIALVHGVDREIKAYRLFALQLELGKNEIVVEAVTPKYIMEPREKYEVYGDRPYTIFPCGLWSIGKNEYLLSYGAGDYVVGIGEIDVEEIKSLLDKGRIY